MPIGVATTCNRPWVPVNNKLALKEGLGVVRKLAPEEEEPGVMYKYTLTTGLQTARRVRYVQEVVAYCTHIPTLAKLADEGFFD